MKITTIFKTSLTEISKQKLELVKHGLSLDTAIRKREFIVENLKVLLKHQSGWFIRNFYSELPRSINILINDLIYSIDKKNIRETTFIDMLNSICEEYLRRYPNDHEINTILKKVNYGIGSPRDYYFNIKNSRYTPYEDILKKNLQLDGWFRKIRYKSSIFFNSFNIYEGFFDSNNKPTGTGKVYEYASNGYTSKGALLSIYKGAIKNGKKNGHGKLTSYYYSNYSGSDTIIFEGEFEDGKIKTGKKIIGDHLEYDGGFRNKHYHGKGKIILKKINATIEGEFKNNQPDGNSIVKFSNGLIYKGEFTIVPYDYQLNINHSTNFKIISNNITVFEGKTLSSIPYKGKLVFMDGSIAYNGQLENFKNIKEKDILNIFNWCEEMLKNYPNDGIILKFKKEFYLKINLKKLIAIYEIEFQTLDDETKQKNELCPISFEEFEPNTKVIVLLGDKEVKQCFRSDALLKYFAQQNNNIFLKNPLTKNDAIFWMQRGFKEYQG